MADAENPFLCGNYQPVTSELTQFDLHAQGQIPLALSGTYLRTGPNPQRDFAPPNHHWFNGQGMLHGVALRGGRAEWYKARWVGMADVESQLTSTSAISIAQGSGNNSVFVHGGRTYAISDQSQPIEISPSLTTVARQDFGGHLLVGMNSHPKVDPTDGSLHTLGYDVEHAELRYLGVDRNGKTTSCATIPVQRPIMVHEFLITKRHLIFFDLPVVLDMEVAFSGDPVPYRWSSKHDARIGVAPRSSPASVEWFSIDPCFVLHGFNAYDDGADIVLDVVCHDRMFHKCHFGPGESAPRVVRWRVMRRAGRVVADTFDAAPQEFPTINPRFIGQAHRFGYSVGCSRQAGSINHFSSNVLIKHDFVRASQEYVQLGSTVQASEFVFVPRPKGRSEDDGWLLGYAYDNETQTSELLIFAADQPSVGPLARVELPRRVPFGFHGAWVSKSESQDGQLH